MAVVSHFLYFWSEHYGDESGEMQLHICHLVSVPGKQIRNGSESVPDYH